MTDEQGRHEAPEPPARQLSLSAEIRDAISIRTVTLVLGVALLQFGFILSYVGAFHSPAPHRIELAVAVSPQSSSQLIASLNGIAGEPLHAVRSPDAQAARTTLRTGKAPAALLVNTSGSGYLVAALLGVAKGARPA